MTVHAMEKMAEDDLDILDVEEAVLNGKVVRSDRREVLGPKYTIEGVALNGETHVGVVGRLHSSSLFDYYGL
jgi:hypothetical protein